MELAMRPESVKTWLQALQARIVTQLEAVDGQAFRRDGWTRPHGGGGLSCVIEEGGVFERGGKFDWGRSTAADRPLAHLTHYKGWDGYPRKGTPWAAVITDIKGKKRSNVATGVWP